MADRWHLLHNLVEVLEEFLLHHRGALREAATCEAAASTETTKATATANPPATSDASVPGPLTPDRPRLGHKRAEEASRDRHERLVEQYHAVRRLSAAGADVADITRHVGVSRRTV